MDLFLIKIENYIYIYILFSTSNKRKHAFLYSNKIHFIKKYLFNIIPRIQGLNIHFHKEISIQNSEELTSKIILQKSLINIYPTKFPMKYHYSIYIPWIYQCKNTNILNLVYKQYNQYCIYSIPS